MITEGRIAANFKRRVLDARQHILNRALEMIDGSFELIFVFSHGEGHLLEH